ncbi:MAG: amidohydrolase, partial [Acidobacteria bacterium]
MLFLLLAILLCPPVSAAQEPAGAVVLEGARLIDGTGRAPVENAAFVIEGGVIRAVGPAGSVRYPKDARVIDARGKT